jgi:predicted Holliday junction resolvase-like endonuclease
MEEKEKNKFLERIKKNPEQVKPEDMKLWYAKVGETQNYENRKITEEVIKNIKEIEKETFRESQALLNKNNVENLEDLEYEYNIENAQIKLGSNKDWYMIYGEQNGRNDDIRFCSNRRNKCQGK